MKPITNILAGLILAMLTSLPSMGQGKVEYFWDTDPGVGCGKLLRSFGSSTNATASLDVSGLPSGIHRLGLRALNGTHFSATYYRSFYVPPASEQITRIEYSWDKAATPGSGTAIDFTPSGSIDLTTQLPVTSLPTGIHTLYLRALSDGHPSAVYSRTFYVAPVVQKVQAIEYFYDTDPGVGKATRMAATTVGDSLNMAFDVETAGLSDGIHHIGIRTLTSGTWSSTYTRQFLVRSQVDNFITRVEYYWDTDPGQGKGITVDITSAEEVDTDFDADMAELDEGTHTLYVRAITGSSGSATSAVGNIEFEGWDALQHYINSLADTNDSFDGSTYTREARNKEWQALYVPFSLSYSQWSAHFDVARINAFYQYDDDEDGVVDRQVLEAILVKPGNGDLKPNYPYLIRAKSLGTFSIKVNASQKVAREINSISCSTVEALYTFTGNYSTLPGLKTDGKYRLRGGTLTIPEKEDETLPPYRWYLTIDDLGNQLQPSANRVRLRIVGDDATGIDDMLVADDEPVGSRQVFDLSGRRVEVAPDTPLSALPKGIYIVNHQKCVVR